MHGVTVPSALIELFPSVEQWAPLAGVQAPLLHSYPVAQSVSLVQVARQASAPQT